MNNDKLPNVVLSGFNDPEPTEVFFFVGTGTYNRRLARLPDLAALLESIPDDQLNALVSLRTKMKLNVGLMKRAEDAEKQVEDLKKHYIDRAYLQSKETQKERVVSDALRIEKANLIREVQRLRARVVQLEEKGLSGAGPWAKEKLENPKVQEAFEEEKEMLSYYTEKTKPLSEVRASDVPRGLSPEDVALNESNTENQLASLNSYTKGNWYLLNHRRDGSLTVFSEQVPGGHDMQLFTIDDWDWNGTANLRLAVTAPKLLSKLQEACKLLSEVDYNCNGELIRSIDEFFDKGL